MSKMSQLHAELSEQAYVLGFEDLGEAEQAGYGVDWENAKLIPPEEAAHEAWAKEKEVVLGGLNTLLIHQVFDFDIIKRAIEFVKEAHE